MNKTILHLSHTDIRFDSRILKELHALEVFDGVKLTAIGVAKEEGASRSDSKIRAQIITIFLLTTRLTILPRPFRYALNLIELVIRVTLRGVYLSPAVVHCHDTMVLPIGFIIKLLTGAKLVYDAHELESDKNGQSAFLSKGTLLLEKLCWNRIDTLITVSPSILGWYREHLGEKRGAIVLNSPLIRQSAAADGSVSDVGYFHEKFGIPEDCLVFVYLGILGEGRGIDICLEAFSEGRVASHAVFVGYGEYQTKIFECSERFENIHIHPAVPHDQVVNLVSSADVGLCLIENISLSDYYCLPNKLFEYAFAGLTVLASRFPDIERTVSDYQLGQCSDLNRDALVAAIRKFEREPPARAVVDLSELSWERQATRLVDEYKFLLSVEG